MIFKFALLSNILLATAALAAPSSLVEDPLAHLSEDRQSLAIKSVTSRSDAVSLEGLINWAGTVWDANPHYVTGVKGTFNIPNIHNNTGSVAIAIGIDGRFCKTNDSVTGFFAGISLENRGGRMVGYAWYNQLLHGAIRLPSSNFTAAVNDKIEITILSPTILSADVIFINRRKGQRVKISTRGYPLCRSQAELIVRAPLLPNNRTIQSLAHFNPVNFNNISFNGVPGIPSDARRLEVVRTNEYLTLTNVSASRDSLTIRRIKGMPIRP